MPVAITPNDDYRLLGGLPYDPSIGWSSGFCPKCGASNYEYISHTTNSDGTVEVAGHPCNERLCINAVCRLRWWFDTYTQELIAYQQGEEVMTITDQPSVTFGDLDTLRNLGIEVPDRDLTETEINLLGQLLGFNTKLAAVAGERDAALEINGAINREANRLRDNIATIGSRLADEAKDRGWCSDYERFITDTNEQLHDVEGGKLPDTTFDELLTLTLTLRVSGKGRIDNARSALSQAAEFRLADQVRSYTSENYESVEFETVDVRSAYTSVDDG